MWQRAGLYGVLLAAGALALQWLDFQRLAHPSVASLYTFGIAAACLAVGVLVGARVVAPRPPAPFDGNPGARAALGISARELEVLNELAAGRSNKQIAARLELSPNTVKTHVARLFDKLDSHRRTDAINRARQLGLVP